MNNMKKKWIIATALVGLAACQQGKEAEAEQKSAPAAQQEQTAPTASAAFKDENAKASYAIGLRYGEAMSRDLSELDLDAFKKGISHGFHGETPLLNPQEVMATLQALQTRKMEEMKKAVEEKAKANKEASEKFLAENAKREGVKVTESGLQYEVISSGEAGSPSPDANDKVSVHYHGTLVDGTVFDSSVQRGQPATFAVNGVIRGWTEALQLMKKGDKWKLFIPSDLAYGERGAGQKIGPNQALVFEVELLDVTPVE